MIWQYITRDFSPRRIRNSIHRAIGMHHSVLNWKEVTEAEKCRKVIVACRLIWPGDRSSDSGVGNSDPHHEGGRGGRNCLRLRIRWVNVITRTFG